MSQNISLDFASYLNQTWPIFQMSLIFLTGEFWILANLDGGVEHSSKSLLEAMMTTDTFPKGTRHFKQYGQDSN